MRVLVLGASGFIGAHVAAALAGAGCSVRAGARRPQEGRRRAPAFTWVRADFADLRRADDWRPLLDGVDAVVNCVGVLQDGAGDSTAIAHEHGPRALIAACEAAGVRRLVHLSAVGADDDAGTPYARSKRLTETLLEASSLDWAVVRPSLVVARGVFGGTALIRALAAFPGCIPVVGGAQAFRPVAMADVCEAVVRLLAPGAPARVRLDLAGPQSLSLSDLLRAYRGWLGFTPAPVVRVPTALAAPALAVGDLLGRLGWASPLRTTSMRQMNHDVAGDPDAAERVLGLRLRSLDRHLSEEAAAVQDRWHARLYFVRPLAVALLAAFWIGTGLVTFGPGWPGAVAVLHEGGYGAAAPWIAGGGAVVDLALGAALLVRRWTSRAAILMALVTLGYLAAATLTLPQYWLDPLGPWLKTLPGLALCLFVAATDERR